MAVISKGITLAYSSEDMDTYTTLTNLQEIPELGGEVEALETTTLADAAHTYTDGLLNYGDSLAFKFLYEPEQFLILEGLKNKGEYEWKITIPDGGICSFAGTASVKLDGVGVNAVLTYTLNIKPTSQMVWAVV